MQLFQLLASFFIVLRYASAASSTSSITRTITVTNGDAIYTKTVTEAYTGQATTFPTSGVVTTTILVSNSLATYTKILTETFGKVTETTTHVVFSDEQGEYTKTLSTEMLFTTTQFVITNAEGTWSKTRDTAIPETTDDESSSGSSASGSSSSAASSSSSDGAAGLKTAGGLLSGLAVVAFFL